MLKPFEDVLINSVSNNECNMNIALSILIRKNYNNLNNTHTSKTGIIIYNLILLVLCSKIFTKFSDPIILYPTSQVKMPKNFRCNDYRTLFLYRYIL